MAIARLTDLSVGKLLPPARGQITIWDSALPGFGLRISQGGTRSFVVMYGKRRKLRTLGRYPALTLQQARTAAKKLLAHITLGNLSDSATAFIEAREAFLAYQEKKNRHSTHRNYKRLLNHFDLPSLDKATLRDISETIDRLSDRPSEARHAVTAIKVFYSWCVQNGYANQNPTAGLKAPSTHVSRDRLLTADEIRAIWRACPDNPFGRIIRLAILTGQRRSELSAITPDMIEGDCIIWKPHQTKNKQEHVLPFGPFAAKLIPPGSWGGWSKAKKQLDTASGVTDWVIHDARRHFSSLHAAIGTPLHLTELLLNHRATISGVAGVYNRYTFLEEKRTAVHNFEKAIARIVK